MVSKSNPMYDNINNVFDFCNLKCRTDSSSTYYENNYRNIYKYCYYIFKPTLNKSREINYFFLN